MRNFRFIYAAVLVCCLFLWHTPAIGQIIYNQPASVKARFSYTHWNLKYDNDATYKVNQFVVPLNGFVPIQDNMELRYYLARASSGVKMDNGSDNSLSGLSDMRVQLNKSLADDKLLISLGLNLPTGKKELGLDEELKVMGFLSQNYTTFPIRRLGEGFGFNLLLGGATGNENSRLGASATYQYFGSYTPYENNPDYDPGDMISLAVNADTKKDNSLYSASLIYTFFTTDKSDGRKFRRPSNQFDIMAGMETGNPTMSFSGNIRYLMRGRMASYGNNEVIFEQLRLYGNEFNLSSSLAYHPDKKWSFTPTAQLRIIGENEYEEPNKIEGSTIFGFGGEYARNIGTGVDIHLGLTYYTGNADGGEINLSGYQLTGGLAAAF